jgi:ATP-binding cassette subfamily B protein
MTGLDRQSERAVLDALQRLYSNRTTLLISHELRHAAAATRILYLEDGRIVESGAHAELLKAGGRYSSLWRLQLVSGPQDAPEPPRAAIRL